MVRPDSQRSLISWVFLLLLATIAAGFFLPVTMRGILGPVIKVILFAVVAGGGYFIYRSLETMIFSRKPTPQEEDEEEESEEDGEEEKEGWQGFRKAFEGSCHEFLILLRQTLIATCGGFYLERSSGVLELHTGDTDVARPDISAVVPPGNIIEEVWESRTPFLETSTAANTFLPGMADQEIKSMVCVPVIWKDTCLGVLSLGSNAEGTFSEDDKNLLARYGSYLGRLMNDYRQGVKTEMQVELFKTHLSIQQGLRGIQNENEAMNIFVEHLRSLFVFDRLSLSKRHGDDASIRYVYGPVGDMDVSSDFPLDEGLTGWVMRRNMPLLIPDLVGNNFRRPRYKKEEDHRHGMRSFLGIPLSDPSMAWGAITLESAYTGQYSEQDKQSLSSLLLHLEAVLSKIYLMEIRNNRSL